MTAPSPQPSPPDHLRHLLKDAEAELHRRLREACEAEANGLSSSSASEIRRLEDSVFAAALAAQKTMKLRRQVERVDPRERAVPIRIADAPAIEEAADTYERHETTDVVREGEEATDTSVREFTDDAGNTWRAWPVVPRQSQSSAKRRGILGDFQEGWICFEGLNTPARRRLPYRPAGWASITQPDLQRLLAESIDATARAPRQKPARSE
ncbi:MAG TPA: hypothetical protein VN797_07125 [Gemmatimonadaceae bacterium]|nr:hypothetical protein [Gemmatimonadaceae bacterium]